MTYDLEHLGRQVDKLSDAIEENTNEKGENNMNDIAGLLADAAVQRLENFAIQHYKVTNVPSGAPA